MKKLSMYIGLALLILVLAACGTNNDENGSGDSNVEKITIKHQLDTTEVNKNPKRVIVFDFGVLDTLDQLGIDIIGLPQTNVPSYLSKYEDKKYENVGSLKEPDFEKIHSLKPDLIIISGRQQTLYEDFKEIAPTIFLGIDTAKYIESFEENAKTVGEIFGKEAEVEKELATVKDNIKQLNEQASQLEEKSLIILANDGNISAYGPSSRFGIIHDVFGFAPVDDTLEVSTHGQSISPEYILERNPDYLFVIDRGAAVEGESAAKQTVENELVKKTNAYKNDQIIYLDPDFWYLSGGGLKSVPEMITEVQSALD